MFMCMFMCICHIYIYRRAIYMEILELQSPHEIINTGISRPQFLYEREYQYFP